MKRLLYFVSRTPIPALTILAKILAFLLHHIIRYRRKVVMNNLRNAFPEKTYKELELIMKAFYQNFSEFLIETLKLLTLSSDEGAKFIRLNENSLKEVNQMARDGKSVVVLSGHNFNWEYCSLLPPILLHQNIVAYKPLRSNFWEKIIKSMREQHGAIALDYKMMYLKVRRLQQQGKPTTCWLGLDQRPRGKNQSILTVNFLNQSTRFLKDIDMITRKMGSHIYFQEMRKTGQWQYEVTLRLITDKAEEVEEGYILAKYAECLENLIHENPANWLWSHKRWK